MSLSLYPVTPHFAAEVGDIDLSRPLDAAQIEAIREAFWKYAVLIFPDQQLSQDQHVRFAQHFGPIETSIFTHRSDTPLRSRPDIVDVSNLDHSDKVWDRDSRMRMFQLGNRLWHTDSSFRHVPARASLLYARAVAPIGGHTEFDDLRWRRDMQRATVSESANSCELADAGRLSAA